jgi:hypothetical protein
MEGGADASALPLADYVPWVQFARNRIVAEIFVALGPLTESARASWPLRVTLSINFLRQPLEARIEFSERDRRRAKADEAF